MPEMSPGSTQAYYDFKVYKTHLERLVHLPSRLRVVDVPAGVERRYDDFCARDAELGGGGSS